jgi:hypothetical protein
MTILLRVSSLLLLAACLQGCFSPKYESGKTACSPAGQCPSGYQCLNDLCFKEGESPDLGVEGDVDMKMPPPDLYSTDLAGVCVYDRDNFDTGCVYAP